MANRKILVGIDYGTTTTRVTYALWDPRDPWHRDVRLLDFAGAGGIPSTINNGQGGSCTWTKILLDANYQHPGYQSRVLRELQASGYLSVPNPHSCQTVIKEFLRVLLNKIKLFLRNVTDFDRLPVDYWFSIPGVYSGVAKSQMLKAIQTAGYTGRPQDNVYFLSEGEAKVAVQHRLSGDKLILTKLQPGTPFLVVDCGGGTTDVTTLEITDATGVARSFTNLGATVGLHAGGTQVDCEFVLVLENELNAVPERMWDLATLRGIMGQIERLKFHFLGRQSGTLHLPKRPQLLDAVTMERTVDKAVGRISWRVVRTACQDPRIKTVILVGGFGQCPCLQNKLRWDLQEVGRSLIVMQPYQHQLVSHGATLFGFELAHRRSGLSLKSYGVVSVVSPGYGNTGEASRVPCWVIRTNDNFQESGQGWLDILLLYDGHGTTVKTIPLIESNSVIAPTRIDDSELFAPGTRWFGTKGSIWQRVDYESGVREVHSICCNLENLSLQNSTVPRQPLPGAGGPVFILTATVHWQFINNPSRIKFTATILGVCVGEKEIHINY